VTWNISEKRSPRTMPCHAISDNVSATNYIPYEYLPFDVNLSLSHSTGTIQSGTCSV
jgi:hypothetical protein